MNGDDTSIVRYENVSDVIEANKLNGWQDVEAKTKIFLRHFGVSGHIGDACSAANLSRSKASQLMRDPINNAYMQHVQEQLVDTTVITRQFLELEYLRTLEQLNGDEAVPLITSDGPLVAEKFDGPAKVTLLRDMGRMVGMDKSIEGGPGGVQINIDLSAFTGRKGDEEAAGVVIEGDFNEAQPT